jgi:hypothetical protein
MRPNPSMRRLLRSVAKLAATREPTLPLQRLKALRSGLACPCPRCLVRDVGRVASGEFSDPFVHAPGRHAPPQGCAPGARRLALHVATPGH